MGWSARGYNRWGTIAGYPCQGAVTFSNRQPGSPQPRRRSGCHPTPGLTPQLPSWCSRRVCCSMQVGLCRILDTDFREFSFPDVG
jgi:hypothetical protein